MELINQTESEVSLTMNLSDYRNIQSLLAYANSQFSEFDSAILNVSKEEVAKLGQELASISDIISQNRKRKTA